jgi:hypothetical protein
MRRRYARSDSGFLVTGAGPGGSGRLRGAIVGSTMQLQSRDDPLRDTRRGEKRISTASAEESS